MLQRFNVIFEKDGDWWIGSVIELPGALTQGRTLEETRENLIDAIREVLLARRELAETDLAGKDESEIVREELEIDTNKLLQT